MSAPAPLGEETDKLVEQLKGLDDPEDRRRFVASHLELQNAELLSSVTNRVLRQIRVSAEDALRLAEAACAIAEGIGTPAALAEGIRSRANALYANGQNATAAQLHANAAE